MTYNQHDLSQAVHLLDNNLGYQQRVSGSPDSDSSSTSSVFSNDGKSSQSSPLSSPVKSERSWDGGRSTQSSCEQYQRSEWAPTAHRKALDISNLVHQVNTEPRPDLPKANPRRTQSAAQSSVCQTQSRCPPQLTRQCDRTQNFVEQLVDTSTQMIEVIWPLSITDCDKDYLGGNNLIGLRHFIQEVLKRSKTSFYTLQVALYYLVLIKPCIPKSDSGSQHTEVTHAQRAMQCGRRMFLAALILASKYLQDRNYSARAWSKISGLTVSEINSNEMAFLAAVNWKLHIPESQFARWTNIIYKYSSSRAASTFVSGRDDNKMTWRRIIPRLTPELDEVDIEKFSSLSIKQVPHGTVHQSTTQITSGYPSPCGDKTPTPASVKLAPAVGSTYLSPPYSPKIPALPTPVMTPHINGFCLPAVRAWSSGQAMLETAKHISAETFKSYSQDVWPKKPMARVLSNIMISSPESMISDITQNSCSSRTSRSSSISSAVSSAPRSVCNPSLSANHRSALAGLNGNGYGAPCVMQSRLEPYIVRQDSESVDNAELDATLALINLSRPKDYMASKRLPRPEHGQKRARPLSVADNNISDEVRSLLSHAYNANETAVIPDSFEAETFVLSRPYMVKEQSRSVGSQAGSRKKQRSCGLENSQPVSYPVIRFA